MSLERLELLKDPPLQELLFYAALHLQQISERQSAASLIGYTEDSVLYREPVKIISKLENGIVKGAVPDFFLTTRGNCYEGNTLEFFQHGLFIEVTSQLRRSRTGFTGQKELQIAVLAASGLHYRVYAQEEIDRLMMVGERTARERLRRAAKHEQVIQCGGKYS